MGVSQVHDYIHRPQELANVNLYEWIRCYKREKFPKVKHMPKDDVLENQNDTSLLVNASCDVSAAFDLSIDLDAKGEYSDVQQEKGPMGYTTGLMHFQSGHPLYESHGARYIINNKPRVPNFVGANLPRCD